MRRALSSFSHVALCKNQGEAPVKHGEGSAIANSASVKPHAKAAPKLLDYSSINGAILLFRGSLSKALAGNWNWSRRHSNLWQFSRLDGAPGIFLNYLPGFFI